MVVTVDDGCFIVVNMLVVVGEVAVVVVVGVVVDVVVLVGLIRHSPDLKSHSCCGQESHLSLQSRP